MEADRCDGGGSRRGRWSFAALWPSRPQSPWCFHHLPAWRACQALYVWSFGSPRARVGQRVAAETLTNASGRPSGKGFSAAAAHTGGGPSAGGCACRATAGPARPRTRRKGGGAVTSATPRHSVLPVCVRKRDLSRRTPLVAAPPPPAPAPRPSVTAIVSQALARASAGVLNGGSGEKARGPRGLAVTGTAWPQTHTSVRTTRPRRVLVVCVCLLRLGVLRLPPVPPPRAPLCPTLSPRCTSVVLSVVRGGVLGLGSSGSHATRRARCRTSAHRRAEYISASRRPTLASWRGGTPPPAHPPSPQRWARQPSS